MSHTRMGYKSRTTSRRVAKTPPLALSAVTSAVAARALPVIVPIRAKNTKNHKQIITQRIEIWEIFIVINSCGYWQTTIKKLENVANVISKTNF